MIAAFFTTFLGGLSVRMRGILLGIGAAVLAFGALYAFHAYKVARAVETARVEDRLAAAERAAEINEDIRNAEDANARATIDDALDAISRGVFLLEPGRGPGADRDPRAGRDIAGDANPFAGGSPKPPARPMFGAGAERGVPGDDARQPDRPAQSARGGGRDVWRLIGALAAAVLITGAVYGVTWAWMSAGRQSVRGVFRSSGTADGPPIRDRGPAAPAGDHRRAPVERDGGGGGAVVVRNRVSDPIVMVALMDPISIGFGLVAISGAVVFIAELLKT